MNVPSASGPAHVTDDEVPAWRAGRVRSAFDWAFRDKTGRVTIVQYPNLSFGIFVIASLVRRVVHLTEAPGTLTAAVATVSLVWWAVDEIIRGVNPWRRVLGAAVLGLFITGSLVGL